MGKLRARLFLPPRSTGYVSVEILLVVEVGARRTLSRVRLKPEIATGMSVWKVMRVKR